MSKNSNKDKLLSQFLEDIKGVFPVLLSQNISNKVRDDSSKYVKYSETRFLDALARVMHYDKKLPCIAIAYNTKHNRLNIAGNEEFTTMQKISMLHIVCLVTNTKEYKDVVEDIAGSMGQYEKWRNSMQGLLQEKSLCDLGDPDFIFKPKQFLLQLTKSDIEYISGSNQIVRNFIRIYQDFQKIQYILHDKNNFVCKALIGASDAFKEYNDLVVKLYSTLHIQILSLIKNKNINGIGEEVNKLITITNKEKTKKGNFDNLTSLLDTRDWIEFCKTFKESYQSCIDKLKPQKLGNDTMVSITNILNEFYHGSEYICAKLLNNQHIYFLVNDTKIHAELAICDNISNSDIYSNYIGISKLCCILCDTVLNELNIGHRGTHGVFFDNWVCPQNLSEKLKTKILNLLKASVAKIFDGSAQNYAIPKLCQKIEKYYKESEHAIKISSTLEKFDGSINNQYADLSDDELEQKIETLPSFKNTFLDPYNSTNYWKHNSNNRYTLEELERELQGNQNE